MKQSTILALMLFAGVIFSTSSIAAPSNHPLADVDFPKDDASLQRGFKIYYDSCRLCHNLKYIKYKHLLEIGITQEAINSLRGELSVISSMTKSITDEHVIELYGQVPPDLSLMAKARKSGPEYIYTLMTGYHENDDGTYDNNLFPGIKMPDVLDSAIVMDDADKTRVENRARDVTAFLTWAADPNAEERKKIGIYVIAYLSILSLMFYIIMKRVWRRLDKMD